MTALAELIRTTEVPPGQAALLYLGQAGFAFKPGLPTSNERSPLIG